MPSVPALLSAIAAVLAIILAALALGAFWRLRSGRVRSAAGSVVLRPADVASSTPFGAHATLVQFSSPVCPRCPSARAILGQLASELPGVSYLEVQLGDRPELATRFQLLQSPTTFVLDGRGVVRARIGGVPRVSELRTTLDELTRHLPDTKVGGRHDHITA